MLDTEELLKRLHEALLQGLLDRVQADDAKPADLEVARKFLSDNKIDLSAMHAAKAGQLGRALTDKLPFTDEDGAAVLPFRGIA